jgi:hypothetical protein
VRTAEGWAFSWSDREHGRALFARADAAGNAVGGTVTVREARSEEEQIWAPSVASSGRGYAVAWSDPSNGRVCLALLDEQGQAFGRPTVVHDGLSMPLMTRVVWNGEEYGIAVGLHEGVYFARVDVRGQRVGEGRLLAEGATVASLDGLTVVGGGFQLRWHDSDERGTRHQVRLSRSGQVLDADRGAFWGRRFARGQARRALASAL